MISLLECMVTWIHTKMIMQGRRCGDYDALPQSNSNGDLLLNSPVQSYSLSQSQLHLVPQPMWGISFSQHQTTLLHLLLQLLWSSNFSQLYRLAMLLQLVLHLLWSNKLVQPASNHAALFRSPVTVEYQQHEGLNNATLVSSLIQQQSQSNSPYLKITFQYNSFNETFINSECRSVNSYEDKLPEQIKVYLIATSYI